MSKVIVLLIDDEDFAWEVLDAASSEPDVKQAHMINADNPHPVVKLLSRPA